jgi:hypothetical protein
MIGKIRDKKEKVSKREKGEKKEAVENERS